MFRTSQKNIEKELGTLQTAAADLARRAQTGEVAPEDALKAVDAMSRRAEGLKRKVRRMRHLSPDVAVVPGGPDTGVHSSVNSNGLQARRRSR